MVDRMDRLARGSLLASLPSLDDDPSFVVEMEVDASGTVNRAAMQPLVEAGKR